MSKIDSKWDAFTSARSLSPMVASVASHVTPSSSCYHSGRKPIAQLSSTQRHPLPAQPSQPPPHFPSPPPAQQPSYAPSPSSSRRQLGCPRPRLPLYVCLSPSEWARQPPPQPHGL